MNKNEDTDNVFSDINRNTKITKKVKFDNFFEEADVDESGKIIKLKNYKQNTNAQDDLENSNQQDIFLKLNGKNESEDYDGFDFKNSRFNNPDDFISQRLKRSHSNNADSVFDYSKGANSIKSCSNSNGIKKKIFQQGSYRNPIRGNQKSQNGFDTNEFLNNEEILMYNENDVNDLEIQKKDEVKSNKKKKSFKRL